MNKRICYKCKGKSYSSSDGNKWDCPYCGTDLGHIPNERYDDPQDLLKVKTSRKGLYSIRGGRLSY